MKEYKVFRSSVLFLFSLILMCTISVVAQVKPKVSPVGGDQYPLLKKQIASTLEMILLEINRVNKGSGNIDALSKVFTPGAFSTFKDFCLGNKAYSARKLYEPQMIERLSDGLIDIRSIALKIDPGQTEGGETQNLVFTFNSQAIISSVRAVLVNHDYSSVISKGTSQIDSLSRERILDFIEQFRMAYNSKDINYLEKVYSDDALIITGKVLKERKSDNEIMARSFLTQDKIALVQQTKKEYLDALKNKAFNSKSFLNVHFEDLKILRHEKIPYIYGVSCWQFWRSAAYSDKGFLFLMMDFRNPAEPVIHVRTWQPKAFEQGEEFISLYDFDIVSYQ